MRWFSARGRYMAVAAFAWCLTAGLSGCAAPASSGYGGGAAGISAQEYADAWRRNEAERQRRQEMAAQAVRYQDHDAGYVPPLPGGYYYPTPTAPRGAYADNDAGYYAPRQGARAQGDNGDFRFIGYWDE